MEQISTGEAFISFNQTKTPAHTEELRQRILFTIKKRLTGKSHFYDTPGIEDQHGNKIVRVDAVRVYMPGRNISYPLNELSIEDALTILSNVNSKTK